MTASTAIAIIGAGPVGSLMSIFFARRGYKVSIFERRPDIRLTELQSGRSINLALANRGITALEQVGLMDDVHPHLIPMRGRMIHQLDGGQKLQLYGSRPSEVIYSVARGELNKILMNAAEANGVNIVFQQECAGVDFDKKTLSIIDGAEGNLREISFEVVIGADGGGSKVRTEISGPSNGVSEEILGHSYKELTIPAGRDGTFLMEKEALHIWPRGGYMLIALPNTDGSFTATLFLPDDGLNSFAKLKTPYDVTQFFEENFGDVNSLIEDLSGSFFEHPTGTLGTIRCDSWHHEGTALIMGDAAHAIVPFHGQGMNAGFEDCVVMDRCIHNLGGDWSAIFPAFEQLQKPNANAIADMALDNYVEMRDTVRDPKFHLKKELSCRLEALYPDDFIPQYSMVMFHSMPYLKAYERGQVQAKILEDLARTATSINEIDFKVAEMLIEKRVLRNSD